MAINRTIKVIIMLILLVINISTWCYIPDPYIECGYPNSVRVNCLNVKPKIGDKYYDDITQAKVRYVASIYAEKTLENHPRVEKVWMGADTAFSHKTWITVDGKEYWLYYVNRDKEYSEIESIVDEVALDLWQQIKKQIMVLISTDILLIVIMLIVIKKDIKQRKRTGQ